MRLSVVDDGVLTSSGALTVVTPARKLLKDRIPTYVGPDTGVRFAWPDVVRVDQGRGNDVAIVKDDGGEYVVLNCRPGTELGLGLPRIGLKRLPPRAEE